MRPQKLVISAWGPYPDREEVDFTAFQDRGIFLITGATGAGKTTIFDAITYALYGALSGEERDKERSSVRSDFAAPQAQTCVELTMEHGGKVYQIRRNPEYLRPKKRGDTEQLTKEKENAILTCPDGKVVEGVREVNAALQELLVLDHQQFKKISMIAQGEFARLLVAPPKEKTRIFREIFGTGVCERFTQNLGKRSRELYQKVTEQKHKLEEDIRLLLEGLDGKDFLQGEMGESNPYQELREITGGEYWNEEQLAACLELLEQLSSGYAKEQKALYQKAEEETGKLTEGISRKEQENLQIERLEAALTEQSKLAEQAEDHRMKETRYRQAVNAGFVEVYEEKRRQLAGQLKADQEEQIKQEEQRISLLAEQKALEPVRQAAGELREKIQQKALLLEKRKEEQQLAGKYAVCQKALEKGQQDYLAGEQNYQTAKGAYEEAEKQRRLSAIGIAASLLREGEPCPVCGATTHPHPAQISQKIPSEEELEQRKGRMQELEQAQKQLHEKVVTLRTQLQTMEAGWQEAKEQCEVMEQALLAGQNPLYAEYLEQKPDMALSQLQKQCDRANSLAGLLEEKTQYMERLHSRQIEGQNALEEAGQALQQALAQYGFAGEQEYREADMPKQAREALGQELEQYRSRVSANELLCAHLKETVGDRKKVDLEQERRLLLEAKARRDAAMKAQKKWERSHQDIRKTLRLFREKTGIMEGYRTEYGYVKDLENLANGNNSKRLVFEQYVLASYFEEILRAANLRFRQMTSGRYEMSRVNEVGDGRVKDSLEIQVLDYYTGKYRSVRTLSGGESFKASLALALGMSDVIQAMNGGIRVDTLFIDEGFGALDGESLDQACDTLMSLVEKNRLIGIISHVPELRERIPQQLVICKSNTGSRVQNSVYCNVSEGNQAPRSGI